jgi:hypothetical protein
MEYRFLAERIRAGFFKAVCGAEIAPVHVHRRGNERKETTPWMSIAFEEIWNRLPRRHGPPEGHCRMLTDFVFEAWVDDQIDYHRRAHHRNEMRSRQFEKFGEIIFYIAIATALIHFGGHLLFAQFHDWVVVHFLTLVSLALPALGATIGAIRSHREYKRLAIRSSLTASRLAGLKNSFEILTREDLVGLMEETERILMEETDEWLELMSSAKLHKAA